MRSVVIRLYVLLICSMAMLLVFHASCGNAPVSDETASYDITMAVDPEKDARDALWNNRLADAENCFRAILKNDDKKGDARRGLILALIAQGDDDQILGEIKHYSKTVPNGPFDYLLPGLIINSTDLNSRKYYETLYDYAKKLCETKNLSVVDRRKYRSLATDLAGRVGRVKDIKNYSKKLNRIDRWAILGPYDNISGAGHRKNHIEDWNVNDRWLKGKFGQTIRWFSPKLVAADAVIVPNRYFHRTTYTTAYLRTCITVPKQGRYLLSISYSGDIVFYVNNLTVHEGSRYNASSEILHWLIDLPPGDNLIAFKVSNRGDDGAVTCSVSNPDGSSVSGLKVNATKTINVIPEIRTEPERVRNDFLAETERLALENPQNPEFAFWNLRRTLLEEMPEQIIDLCDDLSVRFENSGLMHTAIAPSLLQADSQDKSKKAYEQAAQLDCTIVQSQLFLVNEAMKKKRLERALGIADDVLRTAPSCRRALQMKINALKESKKMEELREMALELKQTLRDDPLPFQTLASYEEFRGNKKQVKKLKEESYRYMPTIGVAFQDYLSAIEKDDYNKMKERLKSLLELVLDWPWFWHAYIYTQWATQDYDNAIETMDKVLKSFPQHVDLLLMKANMAEAGALLTDEMLRDRLNFDAYVYNEGTRKLVEATVNSMKKEQTIVILEDALNCDPANFEIRDRLRTLKNLPSYRTYMPDPEQDEILERCVDPDEHRGERAVVLIDTRRRFVFDGSASLRDHILAVQLLNKAGIDQWENYSVGFDYTSNDIVFLQMKTIKKDGTEVEAKSTYGNVIFSNLEPGDVIFLHYQITSYVSGKLAGHFWDQHLFHFPENPCLESKYILIHPYEMEYSAKLWHARKYTNEEMPVVNDLKDGYMKKEWRFTDLSPVRDEPDATSYNSFLPWLDISSIGSWEEISSWYHDLGYGQTEVTHETRKKTEEIIGDCSNSEEVIRRIYSFVSSDINYEQVPFYQSAFVPREAKEVLKDRFGDCKDKACLFISMLKAAGIDDCYFALTTPHVTSDVSLLPSPRFSHVILCHIDDDGGMHWFDPTIKYGIPNQLPFSLAGNPALIIRRGEDRMTSIETIDVENYPYRASTRASLDRNGDAAIESMYSYSLLNETASLRNRLERMSQKDITEEITQSLATAYPGVELDSLSVTGRDDPDTSLVYFYSYKVPEFGQISQGIESLRIPWSTHVGARMGRIVAKQQRRSPIDLFDLNTYETEEVTIKFPDNIRIRNVPENTTQTWKDCRYETSYERTDGGFKGTRTLLIKGNTVTVDEYGEFKEFIDSVRRDLKRLHHVRIQG